MSAPIFYRKNKIDLDLGSQVTITVTDNTATNNGQVSVDKIRNRNNFTGWATTGSNDAANTTILVQVGDLIEVDAIFLLIHNFKSYTIKYRNSALAGPFLDFSTPINESNDTQNTTRHVFNQVELDEIQIVIAGTQTANSDKFLSQLVLTELIGQMSNQFKITDVEIVTKRRSESTLSGKHRVTRSVGGITMTMSKANLATESDVSLVETLFNTIGGFLVWVNAGNSSQFRVTAEGYRPQDLYLMNIVSEYNPNWNEGRYYWGLDVSMTLVEVI